MFSKLDIGLKLFSDERQQLADIDEELKQLDEQLLLWMSRKQKLLKRKKRLENSLNSPVLVDLQSWDKTGNNYETFQLGICGMDF